MTMLFATSPPGFNAYLSNYKIPTKANNYLSNWRAAVTTSGLGVDYYCSDVTTSYEVKNESIIIILRNFREIGMAQ